ncbi:MAG: hypothetical protein ACD_24C00485G0002 [uncultured bacterium]|uniref:Addiction module toxin RelE n=1 Tax=candidate division WWE3 bacterium RBG_16_37_10 TaxID=1802610 RepID=A0A1F4V1F2_UNCKA|nr:MAG: hypothetical protein ACD_24C00485G0002 [uncultured bacterium]OGC50982.1 MAG: hypothetical protein A2W32_04145 [candidate division WWE3 bacterium RBG_16_37_10]
MEIKFMSSASRRCYVKDFIGKQAESDQKQIFSDLKLVAEYGYTASINAGMLKSLKGDKLKKYKIHELIIKTANASFRILCIFRNSVCYLLHAFKKGSDGTPANELSVAFGRASYLVSIL